MSWQTNDCALRLLYPSVTLATVMNCICICFQCGTITRWELATNDGTGAPTPTDMGASFGIAAGGVLTLYIAAPPNGSSVWLRVVDEVSGAVFEQGITADLPASTQFLSPRFFIKNGARAAAVAYGFSVVDLETDYLALPHRQGLGHRRVDADRLQVLTSAATCLQAQKSPASLRCAPIGSRNVLHC